MSAPANNSSHLDLEKYRIAVFIEFWNKEEIFEVSAFRVNSTLQFLVSHESYGQEIMSMDADSGSLKFKSNVVDQHWKLMESNIASIIESINL